MFKLWYWIFDRKGIAFNKLMNVWSYIHCQYNWHEVSGLDTSALLDTMKIVHNASLEVLYPGIHQKHINMNFPAFKPLNHPHPDKSHICRAYARFILGCKRNTKLGNSARSQVHYRDLIATYLTARKQRVSST